MSFGMPNEQSQMIASFDDSYEIREEDDFLVCEEAKESMVR